MARTTKKSRRLSQRVIQRTLRSQKKYERAFKKIAIEIFLDIRKEIIEDALLIVESENLSRIKGLNADFSQFERLLYTYCVEARKLGRLIGITEALELKQYWERRKKIQLDRLGFFDKNQIEKISKDIILQIITSLSPQNKQLASSFSVVPYEALSFYEDYSLYLTGIIKEDILSSVKKDIYTSIQDGISIKNTKEKLIDTFEKNGIGKNIEWRAENIARTEMAKAYQAGKIEAYTSPDMEDFIVALQFSAILDSRISDICEERALMNNGEGLILKIGSPLIPKNTPPLHYQCRSSWMPIDKYSLIEEGLDEYLDNDIPDLSNPLSGFGGVQAKA